MCTNRNEHMHLVNKKMEIDQNTSYIILINPNLIIKILLLQSVVMRMNKLVTCRIMGRFGSSKLRNTE